MPNKTADGPGAATPNLKRGERVSRAGVLQAVLNLFDTPAYLEIGVCEGKTFNSLSAGTKTAVDPKFLFDHQAIYSKDRHVNIFEMTSDEYFGKIMRSDERFDVIYLDGLHTSEQTIRDLLNSICALKPMGVIVVDDVFPSSYAASLPQRRQSKLLRRATGETAGAWMGDVYRLVFFVETFCQQFNYRTINSNHGQLVLWRGPRESVPSRNLAEVSAKEYKDVVVEAESFRFADLGTVIRLINAAHHCQVLEAESGEKRLPSA